MGVAARRGKGHPALPDSMVTALNCLARQRQSVVEQSVGWQRPGAVRKRGVGFSSGIVVCSGVKHGGGYVSFCYARQWWGSAMSCNGEALFRRVMQRHRLGLLGSVMARQSYAERWQCTGKPRHGLVRRRYVP